MIDEQAVISADGMTDEELAKFKAEYERLTEADKKGKIIKVPPVPKARFRPVKGKMVKPSEVENKAVRMGDGQTKG